jgi:mono/diheme cytochrome c family protein
MTNHGSAALHLVAALTVAFAAVAEESGPKMGDAALDPAQVEKGRQIYALRCSHCHGLNMVTAGNVTFDLRDFPRGQQERFFESVTNGKNNRMPPWGDVLTQDEIGDIWAFVRSRGRS